MDWKIDLVNHENITLRTEFAIEITINYTGNVKKKKVVLFDKRIFVAVP